MARPSKSLQQLVESQTFRSRRHHPLLGSEELLRWRTLSRLQEAYRAAEDDFTRRRIGVEFENAIPLLEEKRKRLRKDLPDRLATLGVEGSPERVVRLAQQFRLEDGRRFRLRPFQVDVLQRFLRRDGRGRRVFKVLLLGIPRGNGKTPLASLLGIDALLQHDRDALHVFQVAGSKEQAGIGFEFASGWLYDSELREWVKQGAREISCESSRGAYRVLSSDGRLGHGRKFRRGIADELWLFNSYRETQSWIALETALHKEPDADLIGISTAGHDMTSLLGEKYAAALELDHVEISEDGCLTIAEDTENGFLMVWYGAPEDADIEDPAVVAACNPLLSPADVRLVMQELNRPGADELEWRRLHGNQWTKVKNSWLPSGAWRALLTDGVQVPAGAAIYVAVDAAYSGDCTAVVYAWRDPDGRIHLRARVWSTSRRYAAHDYVDDETLDNEQLVETYIHELARRFRVREIVFDPEYFTNEAKHLARAGFTIAPIYPQSGDMSDAVRGLRRGVGEGIAAHDGDPVLAGHVEAAQGRNVLRGTKQYVAIEKPPSGHKIDAATAACMAYWRCLLSRTDGFVGGFEVARDPAESDADDEGTFSGGAG